MEAMVPINELMKISVKGSTKAYPPIQVSATNKKRQRTKENGATAITIVHCPLNIPLHSLMYLKENEKF
jgi:hypothetical protein